MLDCSCSFAPVHLNKVRENRHRVGQTAGSGGDALNAALWVHLWSFLLPRLQFVEMNYWKGEIKNVILIQT